MIQGLEDDGCSTSTSPGCRLNTGSALVAHSSVVMNLGGNLRSNQGPQQLALPLSVPAPPSPFSLDLTFLVLQVSQDGKALLDVLQRPLSPGNSESLTATANYSKAVHQVLDVVHEVLHHQRRLESIWQHRKVRLHQRLQLCVFQQDVQQVAPCSPIPASVTGQAGMPEPLTEVIRPGDA